MGFRDVPFLSEKIHTDDSVSPPSIHNLQVYPYSLEAVMAQETIGFWTLSQVEIPQHSLSQKILLPSFPKYLFVWSHVRNLILYMDLVPKMRHLFLLVAFHSPLGTNPISQLLLAISECSV